MLHSNWTTRIELKDASKSSRMHILQCPYTRITNDFCALHGKTRLTCLPFRLSTAPRIFTKLLKPGMAYLRSKGVRSVVFLDNILLMGPTEETVQHHSALTLDLLEALGFVVNYLKSQLTPTRNIEFLEFQVDS